MRQTIRAPFALMAAIVLTGCAAGANFAALPIGSTTGALSPGKTFTGGSLGEAVSNKAGGTSSNSSGPSMTTPPKASTGAIGLSTFFDSYNFNFPIPAGQSLGAVANVSQGVLPPAGGKMYLQVGLQTTEQLPASRQPLNVSFVFDKSGSMEGEKIDYSRLAASSMVDQLGEQDTFSLVTFDTAVDSLIMPMLAVDKAGMKAKIAGITEGSSTNIDGGLSKGYSHVQGAYDQGKINRVILMSDGEANVGITDAATLGERAASFAERGTSLTTIGVGVGFNEDFMTHLATRGGGTFYFVNSAADAQQAFTGEIKTLQRIVARGVKLDITLAEGVKLRQVFGHTAETVGQSLNVDSSDLIAAQSKVLLLELDVPAGAEGAEQALASVKVDFDDVTFGGKKSATASAKVRYAADAQAQTSSRDNQVATSVINLQAAAAMLRAAEAIDVGNTTDASDALRDQHALVATKAEELKDDDLVALAAILKGYLDRIGSADREVLKKELQFEAFSIQQGKKRAAASPAAVAS